MKRLSVILLLVTLLSCTFSACDGNMSTADSSSSISSSGAVHAVTGSSDAHISIYDNQTNASDEWAVTYNLDALTVPKVLNQNYFLTFFLYLTASTNTPAGSPNEIVSEDFLRAMVECYYLLYTDECTEIVHLFPEDAGWDYIKIPTENFLNFMQKHFGIDSLDELTKSFSQDGDYPIVVVDEENGQPRILLHRTLNFAPNTIASAATVENNNCFTISIIKSDDNKTQLQYVFNFSDKDDDFKLIAIQ